MEHAASAAASTGPLRPASITLGAVAIVSGLIISGYGAMAFGFVGGTLGLASRRRTLPLVLNGVGFFLGFSAQLMKAALDRGWMG